MFLLGGAALLTVLYGIYACYAKPAQNHKRNNKKSKKQQLKRLQYIRNKINERFNKRISKLNNQILQSDIEYINNIVDSYPTEEDYNDESVFIQPHEMAKYCEENNLNNECCENENVYFSAIPNEEEDNEEDNEEEEDNEISNIRIQFLNQNAGGAQNQDKYQNFFDVYSGPTGQVLTQGQSKFQKFFEDNNMKSYDNRVINDYFD